MAKVFLDTVKLYYEESKAAREQAEGLLEKYRTNTSTLLALAGDYFSMRHDPSQSWGGGLASKPSMRLIRAIDGPSSGAASSEAPSARRASSNLRSR